MADYWMLVFDASRESACARFVFRFGRQPDIVEQGNGCWWLGTITGKEIKATKREGQRRLV